ncbi:MAG: SH3 domain-containing protein [Pseudomonadota bacterium]
MKRIIIFVLCFAFVFISAQVNAGSPKSLFIQVREIAVKSSPNYMSSTAGTLTYGAKVEIESTEGNWYRITSPAGYIPKSAAGKSSASIDSSKRYAAGGVTHDETALAGKGFNPQVEGQYKQSSASLAAAYAQVDKVEKMTVSSAALDNFITQGQLNR